LSPSASFANGVFVLSFLRFALSVVAVCCLLCPSFVFAQTDAANTDSSNDDPHGYLYEQAPDLAPRLDCIISGESGWDPTQVNARTHASGLAQFIPSTWASTPQGQSGLSPFDSLANIDAAIWLARTRGWRQWQVYDQGLCRRDWSELIVRAISG
jgi:hypothetical protein